MTKSEILEAECRRECGWLKRYKKCAYENKSKCRWYTNMDATITALIESAPEHLTREDVINSSMDRDQILSAKIITWKQEAKR